MKKVSIIKGNEEEIKNYFDNNIYRYNNNIYRYNFDTHSEEKYSRIKSKIKFGDWFVEDNIIYLSSGYKIYESKDGINTKLVFDAEKHKFNKKLYPSYLSYNASVLDYYTIHNGCVLYISKENKICEYSLKEQKLVFEKSIPKKLIRKKDSPELTLLKIGDNIVLVDEIYHELESDFMDSSYTTASIYNVSDNYKKLHEYNVRYAPTSYCGYEDNLFIGSDEIGIRNINLKSGNTKQIMNSGDVNDIYVFGEKRLFFTTRNNEIHRVTQDGSKHERIFG